MLNENGIGFNKEMVPDGRQWAKRKVAGEKRNFLCRCRKNEKPYRVAARLFAMDRGFSESRNFNGNFSIRRQREDKIECAHSRDRNITGSTAVFARTGRSTEKKRSRQGKGDQDLNLTFRNNNRRHSNIELGYERENRLNWNCLRYYPLEERTRRTVKNRTTAQRRKSESAGERSESN